MKPLPEHFLAAKKKISNQTEQRQELSRMCRVWMMKGCFSSKTDVPAEYDGVEQPSFFRSV